ncbi:site-specific integrase [Rhizobium hidalgonense]|uniref:Tyr recombinase domain-containing protein n=1 Tax=Rhizobium hidalgonense TaxID=1538159 RepID=A0ABX4JIA7_9HYPH|nr:tyrosine-type recombinase/integrase [Rhizobium hidalgonense]PDT19787.1 hypothetical protein CO674_31045 [Rhizobium hidalgonense]PON05668.1 hypothetical protein ATY29_20450 [Rhizobium hidalgonense]
MKTIILKYLSKTPSGSFEYRRQVPTALRERIGKYEFKKVLGLTESSAIKAWPGYHDVVERQLAAAKLPAAAAPTMECVRTALDDWREAVARLKALGVDPTGPLHTSYNAAVDVFPELTSADALAESWQVRDKIDSLAYGMLTGSGNVTPPQASFVDAARLYVETKVTGDPGEQRKRLRVERVTHFVKTALGKDPKLSELTRVHAREVVAEMLSSGAKPTTVDRYCNDIRAIIEFGIREFELERLAINAFKNLDIKGLKAAEKADRDERDPFTAKQLTATRSYVLGHAGADLRLVWRLLEGSGLRVSEATGLEIRDVVLDGDLPHLVIRFNGIRRLKNKASRRQVPLVGDALAAAKEALELAPDTTATEAPLFAKYGRRGGGDAASAALMKSVRKVVTDPKVVVHSLRHNMQDRMIRAGVDEHERKLILGHAVTGEANRYGSDEARLVATSKAMKLSFGEN